MGCLALATAGFATPIIGAAHGFGEVIAKCRTGSAR